MKSKMLGSVLISILVLCLFGGWMYFQQPSMIFYPVRSLSATPADWGLQYEDVELKSADEIRLHGWYIPYAETDRVLLFFHGNAGNMSHRGESIEIFHRLGLNIFIFDYRGYGQSEGKPSESGIYADARAAWHYLTDTKGIRKENITLFGRSLGGAVAAKLAAEVQPGTLILESTFSSAKEMANTVLPVMSHLVPLRFEFKTVEYIKQVSSPVLIVHSPDDEIIPYRLGEKVFQAANKPKSFLKLQGDHNGGFLMSQPGYEQALGKFLLTHGYNKRLADEP
ncbi:MAG: alpha/beta hydrolase [Gammaproteobacteria bacterium]|nr:alpha/beta hydrolase [Gammaproteobacteria bacterium]